MSRLAVLVVVALAFAAPSPTDAPTRDAAASGLPLPAPDGMHEPTTNRRSTPARPDAGRVRPARDPNLPRVTPRMALSPDDRAHRARLDEAVERFDRAGLLLPDLQVVFSESDDACHGHPGLFDRGSTPWRVSVCSELEFVLTHELAHAWADANLDEARRTAYTEYRGLPAWRDLDLPWRERGTEDAAFVMQQVLMAKHVPLDSPVWVERIDAFEQLTGRPRPALDAAVVSDATESVRATRSPGRAS